MASTIEIDTQLSSWLKKRMRETSRAGAAPLSRPATRSPPVPVPASSSRSMLQRVPRSCFCFDRCARVAEVEAEPVDHAGTGMLSKARQPVFDSNLDFQGRL
jgi:hypothetical protein